MGPDYETLEEICSIYQKSAYEKGLIIKELEEENRKLKEELDKFSDAYKRYRDYEKEELAESCYDYARENDELKKKLESLEK